MIHDRYLGGGRDSLLQESGSGELPAAQGGLDLGSPVQTVAQAGPLQRGPQDAERPRGRFMLSRPRSARHTKPPTAHYGPCCRSLAMLRLSRRPNE
jgi:hypothetical protein